MASPRMELVDIVALPAGICVCVCVCYESVCAYVKVYSDFRECNHIRLVLLPCCMKLCMPLKSRKACSRNSDLSPW